MYVDASTVDAIVHRLSVGFDAEPERLREQVIEIYAQFENVRLHSFLPVLVEKQVREQLRRMRAIAPAPAAIA